MTLTNEDRTLLHAITAERDDRARNDLIRAYWKDGDRADRTPRGFLYLHLGIISGILDKRLSDDDAE